MVNIIDEYEHGRMTYKEFSEQIWGYGQRLINLVGEEKFAFYLTAKENEFYEEDK